MRRSGKLTQLNRVLDLRELAVPPGNRLERRRGDRDGQHSIRINQQYRVCFRREEFYAYDVEVTDHQSQSAFAIQLGVSFPRLNEIVREKRGLTADTALRLTQVTGMSADFWLGLQLEWDLWHALRSKDVSRIAKLERLRPTG